MRAWSSSPAPSSASACASCGRGRPLVLAPVAEPPTSTLATVCTVLSLGPAWLPVLQRLEEDLSEPLAWRRRFLADTEPVAVRDLRVVALRMQGLGPTRISGRRSVPPRAQIDRTCLAVAVRLADPSPHEAARPAPRPGAASHRLVRDGIPSYTDDPVSQDAFDRLWLQGLPLDEIRATLAIGPTARTNGCEVAHAITVDGHHQSFAAPLPLPARDCPSGLGKRPRAKRSRCRPSPCRVAECAEGLDAAGAYREVCGSPTAR